MDAEDRYGADLNLEATELRLGPPGTEQAARSSKKRSLIEFLDDECRSSGSSGARGDGEGDDREVLAPPTKAQIVGWPPVQSYRKNACQARKSEADCAGIYVKVSMDGAPYLRKIDLKVYKDYGELLKALGEMFNCFTIGEFLEKGCQELDYAPTYEDKDGDWMMVGDVPWNMFISSCKRMRVMKGCEARGLGSVL